jgi:hypothetical protein
MRLVKRGLQPPVASITLWLIPTLTYTIGKVGGVEYHREWIWWIAIPTMFLLWVLLNWKIKK